MTVFAIDESEFWTELGPKGRRQALAQINAARRKEKLLHKALLTAKAQDAKEAAIYAILASQDCALASVVRVQKDLPARHRGTLEECLAAPAQLNLFGPIAEPVRVWAEPKSSGGFRPVCSFGPLHQARQDIVLQIIGRLYTPRSWQFTHRGVHKAIAAIKAAAPKFVHVARLDITQFFPSFDGKLGSELPLPKEVVDHVVLGRHLVAVRKKANANDAFLLAIPLWTLLQEASRGIPTGSSCSPIVAAFILARLSWQPSMIVVLVNYADDFLLLAESAEVLEEEIGKLKQAVAELPGGQFKLRTIAQGTLYEGVDFLGHRLRMRSGDKLSTTPTDSNSLLFDHKLHELESKLPTGVSLASAKNKSKALQGLADFNGYGMGWLPAFSECDDIAEYRKFFAISVNQLAAYHGLTMAQIKAVKVPKPHDGASTYEQKI